MKMKRLSKLSFRRGRDTGQDKKRKRKCDGEEELTNNLMPTDNFFLFFFWPLNI